MSSQSNENIVQFIDRCLLPLLEPGPNKFHYYHKKKSASMRNRMKSGSQKIIEFRNDMIKNEFLYNCLILTDDEPIEYLIIGYGYASGHTSYLEKAQIIKGL